ncbi:hypothetical protein IG631_15358 [Alternaria alternata]|nr:hypothetical protein IG631_15358 [Alternaria alternata]
MGAVSRCPSTPNHGSRSQQFRTAPDVGSHPGSTLLALSVPQALLYMKLRRG